MSPGAVPVPCVEEDAARPASAVPAWTHEAEPEDAD